MASPKNFRLAFVAGLLGFVLVVAGCSSSNDPSSWEDAEASGDSKIYDNFLESCKEANTDAGADERDAQSYCDCSYLEVRDFYSDDYDGYKDAESDLRNDPTDIENSAVIPLALSNALLGCAAQHLA